MTLWMEFLKSPTSLVGKSCLPMDPANSVSPTIASLESSLIKQMLPGLCPGVCNTRHVEEPKVSVSVSLITPFGGEAVTGMPANPERLSMGSIFQSSSSGWQYTGTSPIADRSWSSPAMWSAWQCVNRMELGCKSCSLRCVISGSGAYPQSTTQQSSPSVTTWQLVW